MTLATEPKMEIPVGTQSMEKERDLDIIGEKIREKTKRGIYE
ncbi:hypothetical protein JSCD13_36200 [Clostridioides difficile]|nr:hypothetical protein JSCD13_36200 [Clostridioides difficile]